GRKNSGNLLEEPSKTSPKRALKSAFTQASTGIPNPILGLLATLGGNLRWAAARNTRLHARPFTLRRCGRDKPKAKSSSSNIGTRTSKLSFMLAVSTLKRKSFGNTNRVLTSVVCKERRSNREDGRGKQYSHCGSKSLRTGRRS